MLVGEDGQKWPSLPDLSDFVSAFVESDVFGKTRKFKATDVGGRFGKIIDGYARNVFRAGTFSDCRLKYRVSGVQRLAFKHKVGIWKVKYDTKFGWAL